MSAIDSLPEGYKKIFNLSVLDGLSHQEIGALLDIAPHSSSSQLARAKSMLRKYQYMRMENVSLRIVISQNNTIGIERTPQIEEKGNSTLYDLSGKQVLVPKKGHIYIKGNKKVIQ